MKQFFVLLLFIPFIGYAQNNKPIGNFFLENNEVIYRRVFSDSLDSAAVIMKKLIAALPQHMEARKSGEENNMITGNYDGTAEFQVIALYQEELKAYYCIEVKNGKYRVTIRNFILFCPGIQTINTFNSAFAKQNATIWRMNAPEDLRTFDKRFTDLFTLPTGTAKSDW